MKNILQIAVFCLLMTLSACGFKPIYAQHGAAQLSQVYIAEIPARDGQVLRTKLQDLLASSGNQYRLDIALNKEKRESGIQEDLRVSRYDLTLEAEYTLTSNASGEVVLQDSAKIYSSYNRTPSEFSTFVAEEDASEKAAEQLAYEIRGKLAAFFN